MGIPLVALQSKSSELANVESPIDAQKRVLSLRAVLDEQKIKGQTIQENENTLAAQHRAIASQAALQKAYTDSGGDIDKFASMAPKYGASPEDVFKVQDAFTKHKKDMVDLPEAEFKTITTKNGVIASTLDGITALPEEARQAAWAPAIASLVKKGVLSPEEAQPLGQYPGPDGVQKLAAARKTSEQLLRQATEERQTAHDKAMEMPADERQFQADYKRWLAGNGFEANAKRELEYKDIWDKQQAETKQRAVYSSTEADIGDAIQGITEGHNSPVLTDYSFRDRTAIAAGLQRANFDQAIAQRDYRAIARFMTTLNGTQQLRMRQSVEVASEMLPRLKELYQEWKEVGGAHGMKSFNKADLAISKQFPGRAGEVAHLLEAQIADMTSDLGTIYKGGNSSTDESLALAKKNLESDWNENTFMRGIDQIEKNIKYRKNAINLSVPAGVSPESPYQPKQPAAPGAVAPAASSNDPLGWRK